MSASFKFIHAADIHLDSPLRGLEKYEGAPVERIRTSTRRALENLVELALYENVDFLLIAGDLYDGDWSDYNTGLFLTRTLSKLADAAVPVFVIRGNHDAENKMTKSLNWPDHVTEFPVDECTTAVLEDLGAAVHGQGFATAAVTEDLSLAYPAAATGCFNIGLLHTCATGLAGHAPYAPCTIDGLRAKQYDYWALGHVHNRQTLREADPVVAFPGNIQGRHIRETGAKGCLLVEVTDGEITRSQFEPLDVLRWEHCVLDASDADEADEVVDLFARELQDLVRSADDRALAVRVEAVGASQAHAELTGDPDRWVNEFRSRANSIAGDQVWIEKVRLKTAPPGNRDALVTTDGPAAELLQLIEEKRTTVTAGKNVTDAGTADDGDAPDADSANDWIGAQLADLRKRLAAELGEVDAQRMLDGVGRSGELLTAAEHLLFGRLFDRGDTAE